MRGLRLSSSERTFFAALDRVVYTNPFTDERNSLIQALVPGASLDDLVADREALARTVEPRLRPWLDPQQRKRLTDEDRELLRSAFLYVCYHRHVPPIDALIAQQLTSGEPPVSEDIAASVAADLAGWDVTEDQAMRFLGFFFQLRRAFHFIVVSLPGKCESMRELRRALWDSVFTRDMRVYLRNLWDHMEDFSTLLLGETGTGKGQAAAAIGRSQFIPYLPRKKRFAVNFTDSFIAVNLAQFPETLIESELFGHLKGAFTGAFGDQEGVFGRCSAHGALFLDEIGEIGVPIQVKLLRVLQERTFTPLGGQKALRFSGRLIAATNMPAAEIRGGKGLRDDFYYRLCSDTIRMPTLRQRIAESRGELDELVGVVLARITGSSASNLEGMVSEAIARDVPADYAWPGNVRELEQAVRQILMTGRYAPLVADRATDGVDQRLMSQMRARSLTADDLVGGYCAMLYRELGSYTEVAARIGLDRRTVRRHIDQHAAAGGAGQGNGAGSR